MQKSWKTALCTNIGKESTFGAPLARKQAIFRCFFRSPGSSRDVPAASQKPPIFSSIFGCLRKSARIGPWEAPGRPKASPRHLQRSILSRFWIDFPGGFPHLLFRRSNDFLHEVFAFVFFSWTFCLCVTLIRATEKLY